MALGRKTGGRTKGTPNRATAAAKDALREAFESMGGASALAAWGKENPSEFYKLWVKILPLDLNHSPMVEDRLSVLFREISKNRNAVLRPVSELDE